MKASFIVITAIAASFSTKALSLPTQSGPISSRAGAAETIVHTVKGGDTLWGISKAYELPISTLQRANNLDTRAVIVPGQHLRIPCSRYTVKRGDTLHKLEKRFHVRTPVIKKVNALRGDTILTGQQLWIPARSAEEPAKIPTKQKTKPELPEAARPEDRPSPGTLTNWVDWHPSAKMVSDWRREFDALGPEDRLRFQIFMEAEGLDPSSLVGELNEHMVAGLVISHRDSKGKGSPVATVIAMARDQVAHPVARYTIAPGDTLKGIAQGYRTTIEFLQKLNPGEVDVTAAPRVSQRLLVPNVKPQASSPTTAN